MMSIKARFGIALGVVLLLHLFTAVMGHLGLARAQRDFRVYEGVNADTISVLAIDRTISELQRSVTTFMLSGHDASADRVRDLLDQAAKSVDAAIAETDQASVASELAQMSELLGSYGENFEKVAVDRRTRARLVRDEMYPLRERILADLETFRVEPGPDQQLASIASEQLVRGESAAMRYFDSPSRVVVLEALSSLREARASAAGLRAPGGEEGVDELIEQYESTFLTAVQATRGYLHLVNVVLAGQASELLYQSSAIRRESLSRRDALSDAMQAGARRFQTVSDLFAVLAVLAGVAMTSLMTRSVLKPILRMTETLRRLAAGDAGAEIDGLQRDDEIGAMANAAEVFRVKTIQTEQLLDETRRMASDLERRNGEMTQFVYTVSHDLKSPLVTIQGYADVVRSCMASGELDEVEGAIARIARASQRMYTTLDDLLELSRIGAIIGEPSQVSMGEVVGSILQDLESEIREHGAVIEVAAPMPDCWVDEIRVRQVLQNLIQNALRHGRPVDGAAHVAVSGEDREHEVVLVVADNGPGVPREFAEKIFGIFHRLSTEPSGTGVGLAIVAKVAEAHGGRAWVEPAAAGGARFCVAFPKMPAAAAAA